MMFKLKVEACGKCGALRLALPGRAPVCACGARMSQAAIAAEALGGEGV